MSSAYPPAPPYGQAPAPGGPPGPPQGAGPRPSVGFMQAVKLWWAYKFRFSGRASRSEYWWTMLFLQIIGGGLGLLAGLLFLVIVLATASSSSSSGSSDGTGFFVALIAVWAATLLVGLAVGILVLGLTARRLHDANFSALMLLLCLAGLGVVPMIMCALPSDPEGQRFDEPSDYGRP